MNNIVYDKEKSSYFKKISFEDIDTGVLLYLKSLNFKINKQDDTIIDVPVLFTTEERWKKAEISQEFLDSNKKILTPIISVYRLGKFEINKEKNVFSKNNSTNVVVHKEIIPEMSSDFKRPYNNVPIKRNINKEVYRVIKIPYPKFYDIPYSISIMTNMLSHMNKIIEQIYYNEYYFWIPIDKSYGFNAQLESPNVDENDISADERRYECEINLILNGYLNNPNEAEISMYETNTRFQIDESVHTEYYPPLGTKPKNVLPQ